MAIFNRFPFSNMHELNLDWILRVWNALRGGNTNQVLTKRSNADFDFQWVSGSGGGGTNDYENLNNKPQINSVTLTGNKTASQLGLGTYSLPSGGIPASDLSSSVQASLSKANTALQTAPVTSVNNKTGAVSLSASDIGAVAVAQGAGHSGEFLVVGSDGNVTTVTLATWQGGSY